MSAVDRFADGYQPDWDIDSEVGSQGQLFVADIIDAIRSGSLEVKTDDAAAKWQRVYIEYECLRRGVYLPSGLATTKADLWAHVLRPGPIAVVAPVPVWREFARIRHREGSTAEKSNGSHPTRGVVTPLTRLLSQLMLAAGWTPAA